MARHGPAKVRVRRRAPCAAVDDLI